MIAAATPDQKPCTQKPGSIQATSPIIAAFSTSRNSPRVTMVSGRVRRNRIGRTTAFSTPSSTAANSRSTKLS